MPEKLKPPQNWSLNVQNGDGLPTVNFSAGGIATPCDAALMMQSGADGVFVGSWHFQVIEP